MSYSDWMGKQVIANTRYGTKQEKGIIISYCSAPSFTIEKSDGTRFSWRCDLTELEKDKTDKNIEYLQEALRLTRKERDALGRELEALTKLEALHRGVESKKQAELRTRVEELETALEVERIIKESLYTLIDNFTSSLTALNPTEDQDEL